MPNFRDSLHNLLISLMVRSDEGSPQIKFQSSAEELIMSILGRGVMVFQKPTDQQLELLKLFDYYFNLKDQRLDRSSSDPTRISGMPVAELARLKISTIFDRALTLFLGIGLNHPDHKAKRQLYTEFYNRVGVLLGSKNDEDAILWKKTEIEDQITATNPRQVVDIDFQKPTIIYLGGLMELSEQKAFMPKAMRSIERFLRTAGVETDQYDLYGISYGENSAIFKGANVYSYNLDPAGFSSVQAKVFVEKYMVPLVAEKAPDGAWQRHDDIQTVMNKLSQVVFFGYSYGTVLTQEISNALADKMEELGYSPDIIKSCLNRVHAIGIASVCDLADKSKRGSFTILHLTNKEDRLTSNATYNNEIIAETDQNPFLRQKRVGNQLLLEAQELGLDAPALKPMGNRVTEESAETSKWMARFLIQNVDRKAKALTDPQNKTRMEELLVKKFERQKVMENLRPDPTAIDGGHHIVGYLRKTYLRRDDSTITFVTHIGSPAATEFLKVTMEKSLKASKDSGYSKQEGSKILQDIQDTKLTPEKIAEAQEAKNFQHAMYNLASRDGIER